MPKAAGSYGSVQRIFRKYGLQLHRVKTLTFSRDTNFPAEIRDIVGRTRVLCVDEKILARSIGDGAARS